MEGAHENHGHHGRQEEGYENRVDEREPLNVGLGHGAKDVVPATSPSDFLGLVKLDRVGVHEGEIFPFDRRFREDHST